VAVPGAEATENVLIKRTVLFPTFHAVRNELLLEELNMTLEGLRPRRRFSTRVRSTTGSPRSRRVSAMSFIWRQ
jgi:hypothetical protein